MRGMIQLALCYLEAAGPPSLVATSAMVPSRITNPARFAVALATATLALTLTGCVQDRPGAAIPESGAGSTWRWRASTMKVSALTTPLPAPSGAESSLDVRVAFFDTDLDETKAIGVLTVVLTSSGIELAREEVSLSDARSHQAHWDTVTETYSVRLPLSGRLEPQPGQTVDVRAVFEGEDGSLMRASRDVKWPVNGQTMVRRKPPAGAPGTASGTPNAVSSAAEPDS